MHRTIELDLDRCLCVHSLVQLLDVVLQTSFYSHGIIPEPFALLNTSTAKDAVAFCTRYNKVLSSLRSVFRSFNREALDEVIVVLGNAVYAPRDMIRIDVSSCTEHHRDEIELENATADCSDNCGELSTREKLRIFRSLACENAAVASSATTGRLTKVFLLLKTKSRLFNVVEGVEIDESYTPPTIEKLERLHTRTTHILAKKCPTHDINQPNEDIIWHKLQDCIHSV